MKCPNKQHPDWIELTNKIGEFEAYRQYIANNYEIPNPSQFSITSENQVNYRPKAFDILNSDKAKQVFNKGKKAGWSLDKILTELQIPKAQKELLLESGITDREELILDYMSKYSYTVEINTSNEKPIKDSEFLKAKEQTGLSEGRPTQHYSNLTVPGGTNYTENEIATPAITPSIKGHAQFSTDNGIGWFRSDDKYPFTGFLEDLIASGTIKKVPCG